MIQPCQYCIVFDNGLSNVLAESGFIWTVSPELGVMCHTAKHQALSMWNNLDQDGRQCGLEDDSRHQGGTTFHWCCSWEAAQQRRANNGYTPYMSGWRILKVDVG